MGNAAAELELLILTKGGPEAVAEFQKIVTVNRQLTQIVSDQTRTHQDNAQAGEISFRTQQRLAASITGLGGALGPVGHLWHTYEYAANMAEQRHVSMGSVLSNIGPMLAVSAGIMLVMKAWDNAKESAADYNKIAGELGQTGGATATDFFFGNLEAKVAALRELKGIVDEIMALTKEQPPEKRLANQLAPDQAGLIALEKKRTDLKYELANQAMWQVLNPVNLLTNPLGTAQRAINYTADAGALDAQIGEGKTRQTSKGIKDNAGADAADWLRTHAAAADKAALKAQADIDRANAEAVTTGEETHNRKAEAILAATPKIKAALVAQAEEIRKTEFELAERQLNIQSAKPENRAHEEQQILATQNKLKELRAENRGEGILDAASLAAIPLEAADKTAAAWRKLGEKAAASLQVGLLTDAERAKEALLLKLSNPADAAKFGLHSAVDVETHVNRVTTMSDKLDSDTKRRDELVEEEAERQAKRHKIEHLADAVVAGSHADTLADFRARAEAGTPRVETKDEKITGAIAALNKAIADLTAKIGAATKDTLLAPLLPDAGLTPYGEAGEGFP